MPHRLNARLDDELAAKLQALRRMTRRSTTDVVKAALEHYFDAMTKEAGTAAEHLRASGFVGCGDGPVDLSERYKAEVEDLLAEKT